MDSAELRELERYLKYHRLIIDYVYVTVATILYYEYIITLRLEVSLIWCSPRGYYTKALFLLARYLPLIQTSMMIFNQLVPNLSVHQCANIYPLCSWMIVIGMNLAQIILAIRTWAVWSRNTRIGIGLIILLSGTFIPQFIFLHRFTKSFKFIPSPYSGFRGCFFSRATHSARDIWVEWATLVITEGVIFILMMISAGKTWKFYGNNKLLKVAHRDGILFYVYILGVTILNLVVVTVLPLEITTITSPLGYTLYSVLAIRIVFNLKSTVRSCQNVTATELHHVHPQFLEIIFVDINTESPSL